ncbi:MAG: AI-2E family transporter [Candidatus Vogelbacteria bacterium]|nr:AI-2E family transporter [Candidatus Vogelbacteria bacterium]
MAGEAKHINVNITLGTIAKALGLVLFVGLVYYLRDLALVVLMSVVIASAIEPAVRFLARYRLPRLPAVLFVYIVTFVLFVGFIPLFVFPILSDLSDLALSLPAKLGNLSFLSHTSDWLTPIFNNLGSQLSFQDVLAGLKETFSGVPSGFVQTASVVFGSFFSFILIIVISFYLSAQSNGIESFLRLVTPVAKERYVIDLWQRSQSKIGRWMQGQLLLGLIVGVLVFLGLTILQVKYALTLAFVAAVFELIPFFGPVLASVPAVLLGFSESTTLGLMVIGLYVIIQQFENHLLYPLVVNKIVGVPALVVIISLLVGGKLAGFLGIILAVPLATVFMELAHDWEKNKRLFSKSDAV